MSENGVETMIHYPIPPHKQKAYKDLINYELPKTEAIHSQVISLPISPSLRETEVDTIISLINSYSIR